MQIPDIHRSNTIPTSSVGIFVKYWNVKFPLDRWFRERHSIIWGSERHKETTILSMYFDYQEQKLLKEVSREDKKLEYIPGDWYNSEGREITAEDSTDLFDKIDLSKLTGDRLTI